MGGSVEESWSATWLRLSATIYSLECLESEGENRVIFCCTGTRVWFEERIHRTWNVLTSIRCRAIFTDRGGSLRMFLVSFLHERRCLRIDLFKINCYLNVLLIIWFLYVLNSITFVLRTPDGTTQNEFSRIKTVFYLNAAAIFSDSVGPRLLTLLANLRGL